MRSKFPTNLSQSDLIAKAVDRAIQRAVDFGDYDCDPEPLRATVNMLRHEYTDYDADQSPENHRQACEMIAKAFPFLAHEALRQRDQRQAEMAYVDYAVAQEYIKFGADPSDTREFDDIVNEARREFNATRGAASILARTSWGVGDSAALPVKGRWYVGEVVAMNRLTANVRYSKLNGTEHVAKVYFRDLVRDTGTVRHGGYITEGSAPKPLVFPRAWS